MVSKNQALEFVYEKVAEDVNTMYQRYRKKCGLIEKTDTKKQLEILTKKKYIPYTYISNIEIIAEHYQNKRYNEYFLEMCDYIIRIKVLLESV